MGSRSGKEREEECDIGSASEVGHVQNGDGFGEATSPQIEEAEKASQQATVIQKKEDDAVANGSNKRDQPSPASQTGTLDAVDPLRPGKPLCCRVVASTGPLRRAGKLTGEAEATEEAWDSKYHGVGSVDELVSQHCASAPPCLTTSGDALGPTGLGVEDTPRARERAPLLKIKILSSWRTDDGVVWYNIEVRDRNNVQFLHKCYSDFVALHRALQACECRHKLYSAYFEALPELPPPGLIGFRHRFNIGHFNQRRQFGLQQYLERLLAKMRPLSRAPTLAAFLGQTPGFPRTVTM